MSAGRTTVRERWFQLMNKRGLFTSESLSAYLGGEYSPAAIRSYTSGRRALPEGMEWQAIEHCSEPERIEALDILARLHGGRCVADSQMQALAIAPALLRVMGAAGAMATTAADALADGEVDTNERPELLERIAALRAELASAERALGGGA